MATLETQILDNVITHSRRKLLSIGGAAIAGVVLGSSATTASAANYSDADILNFALNLEYLEAEYYLRAVTGTGLSSADIGSSPGATTGGSQVNFTDPNLMAYAMEIAADELAHVQFLRSAHTAAGATPVDKPAIDLMNSFNAAASAAGIGSSFNPFSDQTSFLLGAFIFEDVGVTAYNGAVTYLLANNNTTILSAAAAIHATEAYHAAEIRTLLVYMDAQTPSAGLLSTAGKISALRGAASAASGGTMAEVVPTSKTIVACDSNGLIYPRNTTQVLDIVYLNASGKAATSGGFYPNGLNGTITASTAARHRSA